MPEQVQPDLNQNDETAPAFVKNRTHWTEDTPPTIVWDGSTDGRDSIDGTAMGMGVFYKVSDLVPSEEQMSAATGVHELTDGDVIVSHNFDLTLSGSYDGISLYHATNYAFVLVTSISGDLTDTLGVVIPSTGIYVFSAENVDSEKLSLDIPPVVHRIDDKYMPETMATKVYVDEIATVHCLGEPVNIDGDAFFEQTDYAGADKILAVIDKREILVVADVQPLIGTPQYHRMRFTPMGGTGYQAATIEYGYEDTTYQKAVPYVLFARFSNDLITREVWAKSLPLG